MDSPESHGQSEAGPAPAGWLTGRIGTKLAALVPRAVGSAVGALALLLLALWPAPAAAQQIVVRIGEEPTASVAPDGEITVDVLVDMSDAGGLELADLELELSWDASRLSFVSTADGDFGTLSVDDADAANGTLGASLTSGGTTQSFTLLSLTLAAGSTEELVEVAGTVAAATDGTGADVSGSVTTRTLDVCIGIAGLFGDVTGDGSVNIIDAQQIARFAIGLSVADPDLAQALGDVTEDGSVNIVDAQQTARFVVGLSTASRAGVQSAGGCAFAPAIESVSSLVEGESATISGSGFSDVAGENTVLVDGAQATVTAATDTELTITVPIFDCRPERTVDVTVEEGGDTSDPVSGLLSPSSFLQVAQGEQQVISAAGPGVVCLQLDDVTGNESYLVGVQSVAEVASSLTPVSVEAETGDAGGGGSLSADAASGSSPTATPPAFPAGAGRGVGLGTAGIAGDGGRDLPASQEVADRWRKHREAEARLRAWEREHVLPMSEAASRMVSSMKAGAQSASALSGTALPPDVSVGDEVTVRVPDRTAPNSCTSFIEVTAEVMVVGTHGVWLNDVGNPANGFSTADFQTMSDRLDDVIYETDVDYFGEPTDLDGNSRLAILVTKEVNDFTGILGFVFSGDLLTRSQCASSDLGEIYYSIAPDPNGVHAFGPYSVQEGREDAPFIIAHEFAHVIQLGRRIHEQTPFPGHMSTWELEGGATFAEEVVGHADEGRSSGQNLSATVALNEDDPSSTDWYSDGFNDLGRYFGFESVGSRVDGAPEECTFLARAPDDGPCLGSRNVYGIPWSLLRWISDHYASDFPGGEQAIHRAFVDNNLSGFANLEDVIGVSIETILARWAAALYLDDRIAGVDTELTFPSWDFFEIMVTRRLATAQLSPRMRSFTDFQDSFSVRGGSSAYTVVSGSGRPPVAIRIGGTGGALPSTIQVWVVRTE